MRIQLNTIRELKYFCKTFHDYPFNVYVTQGSQTVKAENEWGVYSLDLSKPIQVWTDDKDERVQELINEFLHQWEVTE